MAIEYTPDFFELIRQGCQDSAAVVVPLVLEEMRVRSVIDVGCGEGWWGKAFADAGCKTVLGIDGEYVGEPMVNFEAVDLSRGYASPRSYDLAVCLEVAEHLLPQHAETLITSLCGLAPTVLFSAAIPGQGGVDHVNEQWPAYWAELFGRHGYEVSGALRWRIWDDERVENWYRQNLLVASRKPERLPGLFDTPLAAPLPLVHPVLWEHRVVHGH